MSLSIGIVGLPNVGKSTLFNALMKGAVAEAADYPFTTIEPNVGVIEVPDERLAALGKVAQSEKIVPTTIKFVDIAGLVAGAHKGEGLGNKFLAHIREVDAIALVVRLFEGKKGAPIAGEIKPRDEIETVMLELVLADYETLGKRKAALQHQSKTGDKDAADSMAICEKIEKVLGKNRPVVEAKLTDEEKELISGANFLTSKPLLFVFNVSEAEAERSPEAIIEKSALKGLVEPSQAVVVSAEMEFELYELDEADRQKYLADLGLNETGLSSLIRTAYRQLDLVTFFTPQVKETRAWTLKRGTSALVAAGKIHSDFKEKFVKAEVVKEKDFLTYGGWSGVRSAGKTRFEGKNYSVRDGDVVYFHHGG